MSATIDLDFEPARELARDVAARLPDVRLADVTARLPDAGRLRDVAAHLPEVHLSDVSLPESVAAHLPGRSAPHRGGRPWLALIGVLGLVALVATIVRRRRSAPTIASTRPDRTGRPAGGHEPRIAPSPSGNGVGNSDAADAVAEGTVLPPPFLGNDPDPLPVP